MSAVWLMLSEITASLGKGRAGGQPCQPSLRNASVLALIVLLWWGAQKWETSQLHYAAVLEGLLGGFSHGSLFNKAPKYTHAGEWLSFWPRLFASILPDYWGLIFCLLGPCNILVLREHRKQLIQSNKVIGNDSWMLDHSCHSVWQLFLCCKCAVRPLIPELVTLSSLLRLRPCCAFSEGFVSVEKNEGTQSALCKPTWEDRCALEIKFKLCLCRGSGTAVQAGSCCSWTRLCLALFA